MKRISLYLIPFYLVLLAADLHGQVRVQVVSKEISKQIEWKQGMSLVINGDNAEITCTSHPGSTIGIDLVIIAKHEDKTTAEEDLQKMKWLIEVKDDKCYIRNYIELNRNQTRPGSAIKVLYEVKVPDGCPVDIKNYFGKTDITGLSAGLTVCSEYGPVNLTGIQGMVNANSTFGDITVNDAIGEAVITSTHSMIRFNLKNTGQYAFLLDLTGTEIQKPEDLIIRYSKNEKGKVTGMINETADKPKIRLALVNCRLTIE